MKKGIKILTLSVIGFLIARTVVRRISEYNLKNKVVLITGGSRGLGLILGPAAEQGTRTPGYLCQGSG
jgi:hypothetical protein